MRADAVFSDKKVLSYLEEQKLDYIVVARLKCWLKREAARVKQWRSLDAIYAVGDFRLQLWD